MSAVPWDFPSSPDDRFTASRPSSCAANNNNNNNNVAGDQKKVDLIHDDWFGLAPLATPESLSEVSSISSRTSSLNKEYFSICGHARMGSNGNQDVVLVQGPGETPAFPVLLHSNQRTPRVLRRTPKINGNLSSAAEDLGSNLKYAMTNINLASIAVRRNLPMPTEDSNTLTNSSEDEDVSLESASVYRPRSYCSVNERDLPVRILSPHHRNAEQSIEEYSSELDRQISPCQELVCSTPCTVHHYDDNSKICQGEVTSSEFKDIKDCDQVDCALYSNKIKDQSPVESSIAKTFKSFKGPVGQTSADSGNYQCGTESLATSECSADSCSGAWSNQRQTGSEGVSSLSPPGSNGGGRRIVPDALPLLKNIGKPDTKGSAESVSSFGCNSKYSYPSFSVNFQGESNV